MQLSDGTRIVFTGDSITDCGRGRPVGRAPALGDGYVAQLDTLLAAAYPERAIEVLNTGISGHRIPDLAGRWRTDVRDLAPDWLAVLIGINDVWRQFDRAEDPNQVPVERFERVYRELLDQTRPHLKGLILMTPYFIEPDRTDPMRARMDSYGAVVRELARDFDAILVDIQGAFDAYLRHRPWQSLCGDRVHPGATGHMLIARACLSAIGFDWDP